MCVCLCMYILTGARFFRFKIFTSIRILPGPFAANFCAKFNGFFAIDCLAEFRVLDEFICFFLVFRFNKNRLDAETYSAEQYDNNKPAVLN